MAYFQPRLRRHSLIYSRSLKDRLSDLACCSMSIESIPYTRSLSLTKLPKPHEPFSSRESNSLSSFEDFSQTSFFVSTIITVQYAFLDGFIDLLISLRHTLLNFSRGFGCRSGSMLLDGCEVFLHQRPHGRLMRFIPKPIPLGDFDTFDCRLNICHS
jgi:hypothetical protein